MASVKSVVARLELPIMSLNVTVTSELSEFGSISLMMGPASSIKILLVSEIFFESGMLTSKSFPPEAASWMV